MLWAYDTFKTVSLISEQYFPELWKRITCKPEVSGKLASLAHAHHHPFSKAGAETLGKRDEIKKERERELTGEMQRLQAKVKCTRA